MKENSKIVNELVKFVKEQKEMNGRIEKFMVQSDNRFQKFQKDFVRFQEYSEKRFRLFYHQISNLQR